VLINISLSIAPTSWFSTPNGVRGPAVKDGPRYQDDEPWGPDYVEYDPPARDTDLNEKKGPEPTSPDAGAYNYDE
jgi:hypothetical protein